jgi:hypothetical protein
MKKQILVLLTCVLMVVPSLSGAEETGVFKKYNPDGFKFEFARSYIASLGYLSSVEKRWKKSEDLKKKSSEEKYILWNIERLVYDNMDIRIAKNYMLKYFASPNKLMLKATDTYVYACELLIEINRDERAIWESLKLAREKGEFDARQAAFLAEQETIAGRRREAMKGVVTSSVLMTKVLLSENTREKDIKKRLALSTEQREKLVGKLDSYAKDNLDWSLKPGQTFVQAAEASVREVLEDSFYLSADE